MGKGRGEGEGKREGNGAVTENNGKTTKGERKRGDKGTGIDNRSSNDPDGSNAIPHQFTPILPYILPSFKRRTSDGEHTRELFTKERETIRRRSERSNMGFPPRTTTTHTHTEGGSSNTTLLRQQHSFSTSRQQVLPQIKLHYQQGKNLFPWKVGQGVGVKESYVFFFCFLTAADIGAQCRQMMLNAV